MSLTPENRTKLIAELSRDEGRRSKPYRCTAGKLTIGVGRNLDDVGLYDDEAQYLLSKGTRTLQDILDFKLELSDDEIDYLLSNDIDRVWQGLVGIFGDTWKDWAPARQRAICNLIFNLGDNGFRQFRRTIDCIRRRDWGLAADAVMKSKYATQVGARAKRVAEQLRNGGD